MKEPKASDRQPYGDFSVAVERAEPSDDVVEDEPSAAAQTEHHTAAQTDLQAELDVHDGDGDVPF